MSFSQGVKRECHSRLGEGRHCRVSELSALLCCCGDYKDGAVVLRTESLFAAKKAFKLLLEDFGQRCVVRIRRTQRYKAVGKNKAVSLTVNECGLEVLKSTGLRAAPSGGFMGEIPRLVVGGDCCKRAYVRGVFLACGSVSRPGKSNHLEMAVSSLGYAEDLKKILEELELGLSPHIVRRKNKSVVYFKDGEQISAVLSLIGSVTNMMDFENGRILKEFNNTINRRVNCQNANMEKAIGAALTQIAAINKINETVGISTLPRHLREIAEIRLANPEISFSELGEMLNPPVGKSGVNHRLKKICKISENLNSPNGRLNELGG